MDAIARTAALQPLDALVGTWRIEVDLPGAADAGVEARVAFAWDVHGTFLVERAEIPVPEAPDSLSIIALNHDGGGFTQHYFDQRGVVRVYAMTLEDGVWTLKRTAPDFSPLNFCQRYVGTFSDDGATITGRWETAPVGTEDWELDFHLTYTRIA
jgi:hypothetical protein